MSDSAPGTRVYWLDQSTQNHITALTLLPLTQERRDVHVVLVIYTRSHLALLWRGWTSLSRWLWFLWLRLCQWWFLRRALLNLH